jgi:Protein of unknown function (DUF4058)
MPLLDHFHPPVSSRKAWEGFQQTWATLIALRLNGQVLAPPFESEPGVHLGPLVEVDVATFEEDEEPSLFNGVHDTGNGGGVATLPQVYAPPAPPLTGPVEIDDPDSFEVLVYRDIGRWKLAAAIELVSPANKDREAKRRAFATKCLAYLAKGVSVVVIDMVTARAANIHAELVRYGGLSDSFAWESPSGLSAVCYRTLRNKLDVRLDVWPHALQLGQALPTLPLWLTADLCVPLELEPTYHAACVGLKLA